ncbi:MAG: endo-alpha-N-acetylgalactosaminidase family protein [Armatimonadota bacterium]
MPQRIHQYHKCMTNKAFLASKSGGVHMTLDQTLDSIRQLWQITGGIKQIVYLVGWQYEGHDSKYPAFFEANRKLKRAEDPDAHASILWLMQQAKQYNTVISFHINMSDAYENSPLWQEYVDKDLIVRNSDGSLLKGGIWDGEQCYYVSKPREWQAGLTQRRIDQLMKCLPIRESGTIHLDAFCPVPNPKHGITREDECKAMADWCRYWNSKGVDVTCEDFLPELAGLVPMVYHFNLEERGRLIYPPTTICGGGSMWNARYGFGPAPTFPQPNRPEGGCLYEAAWGHSVDRDLGVGMIPYFAEEFFLKTLPWQFLNNSYPTKHEQIAEKYDVLWKNGTLSSVQHSDGHLTIKRDGVLYVDGQTMFVPAPWMNSADGHQIAIMAFSKKGDKRTWKLPRECQSAKRAIVKRMYPIGDSAVRDVAVKNRSIALELQPGEGVSLMFEV